MLVRRLRDRAEDDAGLGQLILERGGDGDGIEHGIDRDTGNAAHAGEHFLLAQGDAELLVGLQNLRIDLVERLRRLVHLGRGVIIKVLIVDRAVLHPRPGRLLQGEPAAIGFEPPVQQPLRLVLLGRDEADGILGEALGSLLHLDIGDETVFVLVHVDGADAVHGFPYGGHCTLLILAASRAATWDYVRPRVRSGAAQDWYVRAAIFRGSAKFRSPSCSSRD